MGVKTHMRAMEGLSPDRMKAMIPIHQQMVANMLSSFDDWLAIESLLRS